MTPPLPEQLDLAGEPAPAQGTSPEHTAHASPQAPREHIPEELSIEIRKLAHDLSNALEIIVQTSYLLTLAELKEPASQWLEMLNSGVNRALEINGALRTYVKDHTPR